MKKQKYSQIVRLDRIICLAAVGMTKEGLKTPTIARLLKRTQREIEIHLGWWVHECMSYVKSRRFSAYQASSAAELKVQHQTAIRWHHAFIHATLWSDIPEIRAQMVAEYSRQTPENRAWMDRVPQEKLSHQQLIAELSSSPMDAPPPAPSS